MQRRVSGSKKKSPTSTSEDRKASDASSTVDFFNTNFRENSESSSRQPTTSLTAEFCETASGPFGLDSEESHNFVYNEPNQKKKSIPNFFVKTPSYVPTAIMENKTFTEKTLSEIGFDSTEIPNWDKIIQPRKDDLLLRIEQMIKNFEKTNVQIRIEDTLFNCHMIVLQCYSDFFLELDNEKLVVLPSDKVTPQAFTMVYDWMLSSNPRVQREGLLEIFNAAQFLRIRGLVDQCWVCLDDDERFCEDAAFLLYLEARKHGHELLQQLMLTRICKFFLTLVASKEFLEMSAQEICTLFQSNTIGVNSETEVLMSALRWLSYDWKEREKHMLEVMQCVRFGLMTPWQLVELRRNCEPDLLQKIVQAPEVQKMIDDGLSYVTTKYWYANNVENLFHFMERLSLTEPIERQWVQDKTWIEHFDCPNQMFISYKTFLEYLEMIRTMGKDHWKSLKFYEGNPNLVFQGQNFPQYFHDSSLNDYDETTDGDDEESVSAIDNLDSGLRIDAAAGSDGNIGGGDNDAPDLQQQYDLRPNRYK